MPAGVIWSAIIRLCTPPNAAALDAQAKIDAVAEAAEYGPENRPCHEKGRTPRINVIILDGTLRLICNIEFRPIDQCTR